MHDLDWIAVTSTALTALVVLDSQQTIELSNDLRLRRRLLIRPGSAMDHDSRP